MAESPVETSGSDSDSRSARHNQRNIAIVGGSAAGLFAAGMLARRGVNVRVLEASETLEPPARTLIVTPHMRSLLGASAERSVLNTIRRFEIFTDGRMATVPLSDPDLIIERRTLIQGLADEARSAGVSIETGKRFQSLDASPRGLILQCDRPSDASREEICVDAVIGSDGVTSRVARSAGWAPLTTAPLMQAIVAIPKDMPADTTRVWFIPEDTPYFYWLIPESPTRGALGIIGETGAETKRAFERFLEKKHFEPIEFQGARIPVYTRWIPVERRIGNHSVYLAGDSAAQVKVSTVGGTVTGIRGALGVVQTILHGASSELRQLRRELDLHLLLRRSLHDFQQADYSRLVGLLNDHAKQPLAEYSRDEAWKILWRVCLRQPRLLWMGLRGLLMHRHSTHPL
jgi:flavin-dependent dehydrogenase